ncbi:MAG: polyprenyl synthetase family protein [Rhodobiaceae bacterium]|nr:polyprenyl synthetase family protein [Rhodobiaceae bacterium]
MDAMTAQAELTAFATQFEQAFEAALDARLADVPPRLHSAILHGALAGGKRIRPFLLWRSANLFGASLETAWPAAFAVECVHCYSLVHDDLPAMDDDALRRGKPTVHVAYDEATAILAGDALLALAFEFLADCDAPGPLVRLLAAASGAAGMVGGQLLDLSAEGRFVDAPKPAHDEAAIRRIQAMKTGALIAASCEMGARVAGAPADARTALRDFGRDIGLAFQIADDLLDAEGDAGAMGKAVGKDAHAGKATFVSMLGAGGARDLLAQTVADARRHLSSLPGDTRVLSELAGYIAERDR